MDLKPVILAVAAAASASPVFAQINSKQSGGYAARAAAMLNDGNYQGCIDQCNVAMKLSAMDREQLSWLRAVASFKKGSAESRSMLQAFIKQFPASIHKEQARLLLATLTFYSGDYAGALSEFKQISRNALQLDEADDLDYRMAYCQIKLGDFDSARTLLKKLSDSDAYGMPAVFYLGYLAYVDEDYVEARRLLDSADQTTAPGNMAPYYLGQIDFKEGKYSDALQRLSPLLDGTDIPDEFRDEAERICGECIYATTSNLQRSMSYLEPYIQRHPDDAPLSTRYIVGTYMYQSGNYAEAIRMLAPVSELTDRMGQSAALTIGQACLAQGNTAAALMQFEKATRLDFDPEVTEIAYYNYAVAQIDGGRIPFGNTVRTLEDFIKRYPSSHYAATVQNYLVKGYMATDDYEGAIRSLNALKSNNSEQIQSARQQVNFVLGTRALQSGNVDSAIAYLEDARKHSRYNPEIAQQTTLWLADAFYEKGDYPRAQNEYSDFLQMAKSGDSNRPNAQYNLAYALFAQKKYGEARRVFTSALAHKSLSADARVDCLNRIGDTFYYEKNFADAVKTYRQACDLMPESADYSLFQIAVMQGHMGHHTDKIQTLDKLISTFRSSSLRPAAMTEKATTLAVTGKTNEAISTYGEVVTSYPTTAQGRNALLQLAILHRTSGNIARAKEYYKLVVSRHPSSSEAALAVQDLKAIYANDGEIEELNDFLTSIAGAPQLDAVEKNAIAAASLLRKARNASSASARLDAALQLLEKYPDAEGAEEAMAIAANAEYEQGLADRALSRFSELEQRASSASMRHTARMGILRSARDMGDNDRIISTSADILGSSAVAGADVNEVKFIRAGAFAASGKHEQAMSLWTELAKTPADIFGTRAAFEIADSQFRANELDKAAKTAESLIDANPPHPYWLARTFILYSDILRAQGSDFEADEYLRALRSNYPGTDADIFQMIDSRLTKQ